MQNDHFIVDNTGFVASWVASFSTLDDFKNAVATCDWFKEETLEAAYKIAKGSTQTITDVPQKKKKN